MKPQALAGALLAVTLALGHGLPAAAAERWDLRDLYANEAAWSQALQATRARADKLDALRSGFGQTSQGLLDALLAISDVRQQAMRVGSWALLSADEDLRDAKAQERRQQVTALDALVSEKTAWLAPAIQALGADVIRRHVAEQPPLQQRFDHLLDDVLRQAPHTLSPEGEALLAGLEPLRAQPTRVYEQLGTAEQPWPRLRRRGGPTVTLDAAAYERHRSSPDRAWRKQVFDAYFATWQRVQGSLGANLTSQVMGDVFNARARHHASALAAALHGDDMPEAVYRQLVAQTHEALPVLHRYLRLRQRMLGIRGPLGYHDGYPPLVPAPRQLRFDLEASKAITLKALQPLGDEYLSLLRSGLSARWADSHPRPGKAAGAYVLGQVHGLHPYVLLNHNDDFESLSTLAHEWGHAVHTMLAQAAQPAEKSDYATFIAESASIGNEMLLLDHLVATADTRALKMFYLSQALELIRTTYFRQVMFAEFQLAMHDEVEQGRPLSGALLTDLYCGLLRRYHGEADGVMKIDPAYCVEWAVVSHFYNGFYVWQYATSMVGAAQFAQAIGREGAPARDRFIALLKAGGSDYPYRLYQRAGVDLAQPAPYQALAARMTRLLDEFERLAAARR